MLRHLSLLLLFGCSEAAKLPIEYTAEDIVIVAATVDGKLQVSIEPFNAGEELSVETDSDKPVYTYVLESADFISPGGAPFTSEMLSAVSVRLEGGAPAAGSCARCLNPTDRPPQLINPGDSCRIPTFVRGAVWQPSDAGFACSGAADSMICSAGPDADQKLIEEVRRAIRIDWPGACACSDPDAVSLEDLEVRAIAPLPNPNPVSVFAEDSSGRIAGFEKNAAVLYDPGTMQTTLTEIDDWPGSVRTAVAAKDGQSFIVGSAAFNTGYVSQFRYDRFDVVDGRLVGPNEIVPMHISRADRMKFEGDDPNLSLYLLGNVKGNLGSVEPAMFVCANRTMNCQSINLQTCPDQSRLARIRDLTTMPDGSGFALADHAFYYRAPNAPPLSNPDPNDTWNCAQREEPWSWRDEADEPIRTTIFESMGRVDDRVFVCAISSTPPCEPDYAVVLTATVTSSVGVMPEANFEVVYRGGDWSRCRGFHAVEGEPSQIRLQLSSQRLVDFDDDANLVRETNIGEVYGDVPGFDRLVDLANGTPVLLSNEGQIFVPSGPGALSQVYGADARENAHYSAAVAVGEGDFVAFGHPNGPMRIKVMESAAFPEPQMTILSDASGALADGDAIRDVVVDTRATEAAGTPVIMVAGERESDVLLLRLVLSDTEILRHDQLMAPAALDNLGATKIGESSPGEFVVGTEGTRLLRVRDDAVTEIPIDFDDPDTEFVESRPSLAPDACSGNERRLDAWRAIEGNNGVAWVVGSHQLAFRVAADQAERFVGAGSIEYSAVMNVCPDEVLLTGRGRTVDLAGIQQTSIQFWTLATREEPRGEEITLEPFRRQQLVEIGKTQVESINITEITTGYPRAVLPDRARSGSSAQAPFAIALSNGLMARFFAGQGLDHTRPPFHPRWVVQSAGGYVLYGGWDSRLALGVPR